MVRYLGLSDWIERHRGVPGAGASDADAQPDHVDQLPNEIGSVCRSAEKRRPPDNLVGALSEARKQYGRPAEELVRYLLFANEAPLTDPVKGDSRFASTLSSNSME